jgi:hypothetical protein
MHIAGLLMQVIELGTRDIDYFAKGLSARV